MLVFEPPKKKKRKIRMPPKGGKKKPQVSTPTRAPRSAAASGEPRCLGETDRRGGAPGEDWRLHEGIEAFPSPVPMPPAGLETDSQPPIEDSLPPPEFHLHTESSPSRLERIENRRRIGMLLLAACVVLVASLLVFFPKAPVPKKVPPTACIGASEALDVVYSVARFPIKGVHLNMDRASFDSHVAKLQEACGGNGFHFARLADSHRLNTVEDFLKWLGGAADAAASSSGAIVVWVIPDIKQLSAEVGHSLKALLDDAKLRQTPVLRPGAKGLVLLRGDGDRNWLKSVMPHRSAHMFYSLST